MAYDEELVNRLRAALASETVTEKAMFGGLAFMINGNLAVSASARGGLLLRVDPAEADELCANPGVSRFVMRGRELNGWLHIRPPAVNSDDQLRGWVALGVVRAHDLAGGG